MNWNKNAVPFIPTLALNDDWSDYTFEDLSELSLGKGFLQIELNDNSMYERYFKFDIVTLRLVKKEPPEEDDALILLPDGSLIFRHYTINDDDTVTLTPLYADFCEPETYPADAVRVIGTAVSVMR